MDTNELGCSVSDTGFVPSASLEEGLTTTLRYEFLEDNSDKSDFETE